MNRSINLQNPIVGAFITLAFCYIVLLLTLWTSFPKYRFQPFLVLEYMTFLWRNLPHLGGKWWYLKHYVPIEVPSAMLACVVCIYGWWHIYFGRSSNKYGNAQWAGFAEWKHFGLNAERGLILGKTFWGTWIRTTEPLCVMLFAPAGSGKSSGYVIPNLLMERHNSMLVYDVKGELAARTKIHRQAFSKCFVFNPVTEHTAKYNIFAQNVLPQDSSERSQYIANVATVLLQRKSARDDFFINEARNVFRFFSEYLIWKHGYTSLPDLYDAVTATQTLGHEIKKLLSDPVDDVHDDGFFTQKNTAAAMPEYIKRMGRALVANFAGKEQWAGVQTTFRQSLDSFATSRYIRMATSGGCDFDAKQLRKENTTVYFTVADKDREALQPLLRVIFDTLNTGLISQLPEKDDLHVTYILDEFIRLGKMVRLIEMPEVGRQYNVNAIFVAQDESQIRKVYSADELDSLKANCAYHIVLRQNHLGTAECISKLIGRTTTKRRAKSQNHINNRINQGSQGESVSEEGLPLVSEQKLLALPKHQAILLVQGFFNRPIKTRIPFYFKDAMMQKLTTLGAAFVFALVLLSEPIGANARELTKLEEQQTSIQEIAPLHKLSTPGLYEIINYDTQTVLYVLRDHGGSQLRVMPLTHFPKTKTE